MAKDSKWSVSYLKSLPSKWSSSVETAPRPDPSTNIEVCQRDCVAHLYLLEKFAIVEKRVADIALEHNVDASLAWCAYVNLAIGRFVKWISRLGADRTHDILPPLDVLLVWHAFLQHPERWTAFCNLAGVPIESWSWHILLVTIQSSGGSGFDLPQDSKSCCQAILGPVDLLQVIQSHIPNLRRDRSHSMVTSAADLMIRKSSSTSILTPNGTITIDVDFHTVIKRQLSFARHMLQYSWHRMPSATSRPTKRVFAEAISRYDKFMDLFIYWRWIQGNSSPTTHAISHLIPAPDVDLAWRTHILSPKQYKRYCMSKGLRRDITHPVDREAAEGPTDKHITSSLYKYVFKECLQICLCWFCCMDTAFPYCFGTPKKLIRQSLEAEVARRRDLKLDIPLDYAQRRCSRCSWHRGSSCRARDNYRPEASEYNEKDNDACLVFKGKRIVTLLPSHRDGEILKFPHERIHRNQQPSRSEPPLIRQGGLVPPPAHQYKRLRSAEDPFRDPEPTEESSQDEHSPRVAESQALEHYTAERANASSPLAPGGPSYSNASADNEMNIPEDHGQTAPSQRSLIADSSASSRTRPTPSRIFGKLLATTNEGDVWWSPPKPRPRADTSRGHVLATMPPLVENTDDE